MTAIHRSTPSTAGRRRAVSAAAATATGLAMMASTVAGAASAQAADPAAAANTLQGQFASAAAEFHIPQSVLLALSYQETRWDSHQGQPSTTGNYNVMGLTDVDVAATDAAAAADAPEVDQSGSGTPAPNAVPAPAKVVDSPALHTLAAAAKLINQPDAALRTDSAQSIRGAAALLAQYQQQAGKPAAADPGAWYGAVVQFGQSPAADGGTAFANRVFGTLRQGASRVTAEGQSVTLTADPGLQLPQAAAAPRAVTPGGPTECPASLNCEAAPAASANYSTANRPADGDSIQYIVIHDTEGGYAGSLATFQSAASQVSAHYLVRSSDGHVAQLMSDKDIAWHTGNKTFNMHSIGIEHEGYAAGVGPGNTPTWYSEQLYQSSAALTQYLAAKYNIPLDRQHIIGHDDVPKQTELDGSGNPMPAQHWDPGTFWDWQHYMQLMGAPIQNTSGASLTVGGTVTVAPPFTSANQPPVDNTAARPENFVYLYTSPSTSAPLVNGGTTQGSDVTDKAVAGATYVVADLQGDWTAIWYGGTEAWFYNPGGQTGIPGSAAGQTLITPKPGAASIPVYGRSNPEQAAYANYPGVYTPYLAPVPVNATIAAGQSYVSVSGATPVKGDYFYDGTTQAFVVGSITYYPIRFNHRLAFVASTDVQATTTGAPATASGYTPAGPTRLLDTRDGTGGTSTKVGQGGVISLQIAGRSTSTGTIPADATAVVLNVTATNATSSSYVSVYPFGQARSSASNLNFTAGETIPNLVVVPVSNGKVSFYNFAGSVDLIADVTGYYSPEGASKLTTAGPHRLLDTRDGTGGTSTKVGQGGVISLQVAGASTGDGSNVPDNVTAVVLNVTATNPTASSFVSVYPDSQARSSASNLNFTAGQTIPNLVVVPVVNGKVDFYNLAGSVDLIADISGYYTPTGGSSFFTAGPSRLLDTRDGTGGTSGAVGQGGVVSLQVAGRAGLPATGVTAVVLNVTATDPTSDSFVSVYPDGQTRSSASNLNFTAGETIPNLVIVPVVNGKVDFYNFAGNVNLIADITGYYTN
ncbi:N-acetyl-anhydromuramyl-L-alanine amidase AmpD [Kitasatospora sp. MAA4]|uniref:peptidoglycan recognition family protein n=1 Tax=Kitasatospora sp. MAA4 TaxID=3035093 RepID=UPI002476765A|nr:peptidoglycan recognition family protein [Kitasatospora sp. MAA4]MDH6134057.1 N-acetyl-anhydromuramyl-L-alanine amidase AmpD [Kitasatospora sp. MAA4]